MLQKRTKRAILSAASHVDLAGGDRAVVRDEADHVAAERPNAVMTFRARSGWISK